MARRGFLALSPLALLHANAWAAAGPASLLDCFEPIARTFHVRIVDNGAHAGPIACPPLSQQLTLEQAMDRMVQANGLSWRRLDDGTLEVAAASPASRVKLPTLAVEGDPLPDLQRPDSALATPLVEHASAATTLDQRWLDTAALLGFNQIGAYAPNVYGSGQSLAIRGTERDTDYFPALTVLFDGIELGTRLLDDELVPLGDVTNLALARGPRAFEFGAGSQAGVISLKTSAPSVEPQLSVALGVGDPEARSSAVAWSGPLPLADLTSTFALDRHELPSYVHQRKVPQANVGERSNDFGRIKLAYTPDSGLSAQLSALALSGDSSDRQVVPPTHAVGQPAASAFDPFDRESFAAHPLVAQTRARGAAGYIRYDHAQRWTLDAHASATSIARDTAEFPQQTHWSDHELRRRSGVTLGEHPAADWTINAELDQEYMATLFHTPTSTGPLRNYFSTTTYSGSVWLEHAWNPRWTAGVGARWLYERTTVFVAGDRDYAYRVPIPLASVEWHPWIDQAFALSYGTGFRSGGQINAGDVTYVPERSANLELSWRAQWLNGLLRTAMSTFAGTTRNRYTYELSEPIGEPVLASVRDRGLEFELDADLSDRWRLRAGVGLLKSRFSSFAYRYREPTSEAPPHTAVLGVRYGLSQGWYGAADAYRAASAEYYNPSGHLPGYDVLSLRIGYRTGKWDAALIAANALDKKYVERVQLSAGNELGYRLGDPRRIELFVRKSW